MYYPRVRAIFAFILLSTSFITFAESNFYSGTVSNTDKKNTYPVEVVLFEESRNGTFGIINYPSSSCSLILVRSPYSDSAYRAYKYKGSCRSGVFVIDNKNDKLNLTSYGNRDKKLKNPQLEGAVTLSVPSPEFQLVVEEFSLSNPQPLPIESSNFDLQSFPIFFGENSRIKLQKIYEMRSFLDARCAVIYDDEKQRRNLSIVKLKDLPNCKLDEAGFKKYTEHLYRRIHKPQIDSHVRNFSLNENDPTVILAKKCIINGFVKRLTHAEFQQLEFGQRVFTASNGPGGNECRRHLSSINSRTMPSSYSDSYTPSIFTNWDSNPNKDVSLISEIARQFNNTKVATDKVYAEFTDFDVVGIYLGQSLSELTLLFPSLVEQTKPEFEQMGLTFNHQMDDSLPISLLSKLYGKREGVGYKGDFNENNLAQVLSIESTEAERIKKFLAIYKSISVEQKQEVNGAINIMINMFGSMGINVGYSGHYELDEHNQDHPELLTKNIASLKLTTDVFRRIKSIDVVRRFPGIVDVNTLSDRIYDKYKALGKLDVKSSTDTSFIQFYLPTISGSITIVNETNGTEPTTRIHYQLKAHIAPKIISHSLMPDVKKMFDTIIDENSSNIKDGTNIEI